MISFVRNSSQGSSPSSCLADAKVHVNGSLAGLGSLLLEEKRFFFGAKRKC